MTNLVSTSLLVLLLSACGGKSKQSDGSQTNSQSQKKEEEKKKEDKKDEKKADKNDVTALLDELKKLVADCKSKAKLEKLADKYYIGKEIPEKTFKNIAGVFVSCGEDVDTKIFKVLDQIYEKGGDEKADKAYEEQFGNLLKSVQVNLGQGLTKIPAEGDVFQTENATFFKATGTGTVNVEWKSGSTTVSSEVVIYNYTAAQVTRGAEIYANGVAAAGGNNAVRACASCHAQANGADHTANRIGRCSDIELAGAITTGTYANDSSNPNSECAGYTLNAPNHVWQLSAADTAAVTVHLRGLSLKRKVGREATPQ